MSWSGSVPHNFHRNQTGGTQGEPGSYWNHNVHYQGVILNAVPAGCGAAISDVTWAQARATARRLLPGVRYRRRLLWRYSLIWDKPA